MKMTSQLVTLVIAAFVCSAAVVYAQTATPVAPDTTATTVTTVIQPSAAPTTPRPAVITTPPPVYDSTPAPPADASTAAQPDTPVTDAPMTSGNHDGNDGDGDGMEGDGDGMKGDGDMDGHKGHDDDEKDGGGLRRGDIALAILATLIICGVLGTFIGLCYWKYKGNSYVTVTADTTYRQ